MIWMSNTGWMRSGDTALGYDVKHAHVANDDFDACIGRGAQVPEIVLVSKSYAEKRRKHNRKRGQRSWKVAKLNVEVGESSRNPEEEDKEIEQFLDVSSMGLSLCTGYENIDCES